MIGGKTSKKGLDAIGYDKANDVEILAFACPFCHKEFKRHHALRNHVEIMHPEPGSNKKSKYQCELCGTKCASKGGLKHHTNLKHSNNNRAAEKPTTSAATESKKTKIKNNKPAKALGCCESCRELNSANAREC